MAEQQAITPCSNFQMDLIGNNANICKKCHCLKSQHNAIGGSEANKQGKVGGIKDLIDRYDQGKKQEESQPQVKQQQQANQQNDQQSSPINMWKKKETKVNQNKEINKIVEPQQQQPNTISPINMWKQKEAMNQNKDANKIVSQPQQPKVQLVETGNAQQSFKEKQKMIGNSLMFGIVPTQIKKSNITELVDEEFHKCNSEEVLMQRPIQQQQKKRRSQKTIDFDDD